MRFIPIGAVPCLLVVQAAAQTPLTFNDIQGRARSAPEQWRADAQLAERQLQVRESAGFLREGPTLSFLAGPRRVSGASGTTDQAIDLDLPLFLSPKVRAELKAALGQAHPLLQEAARLEAGLRLRTAYLDAWLASRLLALREADLATVERWLRATQSRFEAGADPAFQVALVEGERLKVLQDLDEARGLLARTWGSLVALAELPRTPLPLAEPGALPELAREGLAERLEQGPLRKALLAQAELEERSLRLKESLSLNRWSLRGSYAREGEERVARVGVAVRLAAPGQTAAIRRQTETQIRAVQGEARQALAELEARALGAISRLDPAVPAAETPDFAQANAAVELRLQEGRERPSEALPIRRQLLEAQMASLRRIHSRHLLAAELLTLLPEVNP